MERRRFQQHVGGVGSDLAVCPAHHAADTNRLHRVRNQEVVGRQLSADPVEGRELLAIDRSPHHHMVIGDRIQVKGVQRLVELQHHVVGHVHYVVDGSQSGAIQPFLQPLWRGPDADASDHGGRVALAEFRVFDGDHRQRIDPDIGLGVSDLRNAHRLTGNRSDLPRHAQDGQAVAPVGRQLQLEEGVAQHFIQRRAHDRVIRENDYPLVFVADLQLRFRADHPFGNDPAYRRRFKFFPAPAVHVHQGDAGAREANLLSRGHVGRPADHFQRRPVSGINLAKRQRVRVGMWSGGAHVPDHATAPITAREHVAHLNAAHGQPVGQLIRVERDVNVLGKPGKRNQHDIGNRVRCSEIHDQAFTRFQ